ncbi:MAG: LamG domain-containing protein [Candidatus Latescibacterota bacterium]
MSNEDPSFQADLKNTLDLQAGVGGPTFTRATTATVTDFEGLIKNVKSGEARFEGARRVENLVSYSEDFNNVAWTKGIVGSANVPVVTANYALAPDGTMTADRIQFSTIGTTSNDWSYMLQNKGGTMGRSVASIWLKTNDGSTKTIHIDGGLTAGVYTIGVTVTGTWQRFQVSYADITGLRMAFYIIGSVTTSADILAWGAQLEEVTGQANQNPSEYVSVGVKTSAPYHGANVDGVKYFTTYNGNTTASNVVTEATGAAIPDATLHGYVAEGARTNLALQSEDLSVWSAVGPSDVTVNTETSPAGTLKADKFSNGSSGQKVRYQNATLVSGTVYTISFYAKAAEQHWVQIAGGLNGFGTDVWANFDLQNGVVGSNKGGSQTESITYVGNGWYRCSITATSILTGSGTAILIILTNDSDAGTRGPTYNNTSTDGLYVWGAQLEAGSFASSYIPTTTASVTRNADVLTYPFINNAKATVGSAYAEPHTYWSAPSDNVVRKVLGFYYGWGSFGVINSPNNPATYIGSSDTAINSVVLSGLSSMNTGVRRRGVSWGGSTKTVFGDGLKTSGAFNGNMGSMAIGIGNSGDGVLQWDGTIRNVKIWKKALTDTQLTNMTSTDADVSGSAVKATTIGSDGASFQADLKSTLDLQAGVGVPTFTRATIATVADFEGLIKTVKSGEARFEGARRVENLISNSEAFDNWGVTTTSVVSNVDIAPDGTLTADRITFPSGCSNIYNTRTLSPGTYVLSVYAKTDSMSNFILQAFNTTDGSRTSSVMTTTSNWKRFKWTITVTNTETVFVYLSNSCAYVGSILAWGYQVENVTGQANQNPSEYLSTNVKTSAPYHGANVDGVKYFTTYNGNTTASNVVTEAVGAAIPDATLHGYVAEGARTNLVLQSGAFDNASWLKSNVTATADATVAPSGASTADTLTENTSANVVHFVSPSNYTGSAQTMSYSFYAKANGITRLEIISSSDVLGIGFNLTTGTVVPGTYVAGQGTGTIVNVGNDWYRCTFTWAYTGVATSLRIVLHNGTSVTYTGDGTSGIYLWGAQLEAGSFASSYIPTTTASVTRNADVLRYPLLGSNQGGSMYFESNLTNKSIGGFEGFLSWSSATDLTNYFGIVHHSNTKLYLANAVGGVSQGSVGFGANYTNGSRKVAVSFKTDSLKYYESGALIQTDTSATIPTNLALVSVGMRSDSVQLYGAIRNVRLWKKALSDGQLTELTSADADVSAGAVKKTTVNVNQNDKLTNGLVGLWSFNGKDISGATAYDRSGQNNHGTLTGGVTKTIGKVGQALSFDGVDDYVNTVPASGLAGSATFTVSFWAKPVSTVSNKMAVAIRNEQSNVTLFGIYPADNVTGAGARVFWNNASIIDENGVERAGSWHHYLFVSRSSTNHELYVDGQSVGTSAISRALPNPLSNITIGAWYPTNQHFNGALDEVRIYNRALSATEVSSLYNLGR